MKLDANGVEIFETYLYFLYDVKVDEIEWYVMKVCVVTDEISSDPETAIEIALDWGIRHFELRGTWGRRVPDTQPFQREYLKRIFMQYGVDVVAISPGIFKCDIEDAASVERDLTERLPRSIEFAKDFETNLIIMFGFIGKSSDYDKHFDRIVDLLREAADYASKKDVLLALENEPICFADTGKRTAELVEVIQRKNLLINWDPCNAYTAGEHPSEGYNYVKESLVHVHLKDGIIDKKTGKNKYVPFGEGEVGLLNQIKALKSNAYSGYMSIETHFAPKVKGTFQCWEKLESFLEEIGEEAE